MAMCKQAMCQISLVLFFFIKKRNKLERRLKDKSFLFTQPLFYHYFTLLSRVKLDIITLSPQQYQVTDTIRLD